MRFSSRSNELLGFDDPSKNNKINLNKHVCRCVTQTFSPKNYSLKIYILLSISAKQKEATIVVRVGNNRPDLGVNPICNRFTGVIEEGRPLFLPCNPPMPGIFFNRYFILFFSSSDFHSKSFFFRSLCFHSF